MATFDRFKRPIESYHQTWLGVLALAVIGAVVAALVLYGGFHVGKTHFEGEFAQAAQIRKGNQVTVAGIPVGSVDSVQLAGDRVVVGFTVRNDVHVGANSRAAIKLTTMLGTRYLELSPAGGDHLEHRRILLANTQVPYDLVQTLAGATTTFEPVDAERMIDSVRTLGASLQGLPDALPEALDDLNSLATIMAGRREQLGTLLSHADTLTRMLRDQQADLGSLVLQGRDLLGEITTRRAAVQRLFASVTTLVARIKTILDDEPELNKLLGNVEDFTHMMADHDALVRNILQMMPVTMRNFANSTGSSNSFSANLPSPFIDSWMCAISGRAKQFDLTEYYKDCE